MADRIDTVHDFSAGRAMMNVRCRFYYHCHSGPGAGIGAVVGSGQNCANPASEGERSEAPSAYDHSGFSERPKDWS